MAPSVAFCLKNVVIGFSVHLPVTLMLMCQLTRSLAGCPHLGIASSMLTLLKQLHGKMSPGPAVPSNVHCGRGKAAASPNFLARGKGVPSPSHQPPWAASGSVVSQNLFVKGKLPTEHRP